MNPIPSIPSSRPTRVRYGVVGFCVGLAVVTYLDRACLATLAPDIMRDLGLSKNQMIQPYLPQYGNSIEL